MTIGFSESADGHRVQSAESGRCPNTPKAVDHRQFALRLQTGYENRGDLEIIFRKEGGNEKFRIKLCIRAENSGYDSANLPVDRLGYLWGEAGCENRHPHAYQKMQIW